MSRGRIFKPVVCYKRTEEGIETIIREFASTGEAKVWASKNDIMGYGTVTYTIKNNRYPNPLLRHQNKYKNRHLYRFALIDELASNQSSPSGQYRFFLD